MLARKRQSEKRRKNKWNVICKVSKDISKKPLSSVNKKGLGKLISGTKFSDVINAINRWNSRERGK